jgi:hypothetical protein
VDALVKQAVSKMSFEHSCPTGLIGERIEVEDKVGLQLGDLPQGRSCKEKQTASQRAAGLLS